MIVRTLMTKKPITVQPETTLGDAARIMLANHISGLPVLDKMNILVGMITEGDLLRRSELGTAGQRKSWLAAFLSPGSMARDYVHTHGRLVREIMTANPYYVTPEDSLTVVTDLMLKKHFKRLPVLDGTALVGIISRLDLLRSLAPKLIEITQLKTSDQEIHDYILATLAREQWAPKSGIRVEVTKSIVNLEGIIFSDEERQAVLVIAENAPGVEQVHDHLMFVDPGSGMAFAVP